MTNLDRYKADLDALVKNGELLESAIQSESLPAQFDAALKKALGDKAKEFKKALPRFATLYQVWYSEAKALIRQVLPDRLADFVRHYEAPKSRKEMTNENYRIEDSLQGITVTRGWEKEKVVGLEAAVPHFQQQLAILKAVRARFESSLFDIRQLVQADLFDSEVEAARELAKKRFLRAAGAVAGVVLEKHLAQVCANHSVVVKKRHPGISDLNDLLKQSDAIDVPTWRFVQHLGDLRNLCDHNKTAEPTAEQIEDLVAGVEKILKTLF